MKTKMSIALILLVCLTLCACSGGTSVPQGLPQSVGQAVGESNSATPSVSGAPAETGTDTTAPETIIPETTAQEETEPVTTTAPIATESEETEPATTTTPVATEPEPTEAEPTKPEPTKPEPTKPEPTEPEPTEPVATETVVNEFFNENNNFYETGKVSIRPRHVYWDGNVLVAQCFVINGMDTTVYNIRVNALGFANSNGLIADASFGGLQDLTLEPHTHALWTFRFAPDVVSQFGANLSQLDYRSDITSSP